MPPADLIIELFLKVILPSLAAAAIVMLLVVRVGGATIASALALPAGVAAGNWFRESLPWIPEEGAWEWLPAAALAALAGGLLARIPQLNEAVGWRLRAFAMGLAVWLIMPAAIHTELPWLFPTLLAAALANDLVLELADDAAPGGGVAISLAAAFAGAAILIHAHTARLADVGFLFGFSLAGVGLAAWWLQTGTVPAMPAAAVVLPGLLLNGHYTTFSDVPWLCFALAALSPLALALTLLPPLTQLSGFRLLLVQVGLVLLPILIAVGLAMHAAPLEFE